MRMLLLKKNDVIIKQPYTKDEIIESLSRVCNQKGENLCIVFYLAVHFHRQKGVYF